MNKPFDGTLIFDCRRQAEAQANDQVSLSIDDCVYDNETRSPILVITIREAIRWWIIEHRRK